MRIPAESEIRDELLRFFNSDLFKHPKPVGPDDELLRSGLLDSFGFVVLLTHFEATYRVSVSPEDLLELEHFQNATRLASYLAKKLGCSPARSSF